MEPQDQQPSGDYGYDMAHEETGRGRRPGEHAERQHAEHAEREHPTASPGARSTDPGEDYGYDEAHSF